MKEQEDALQKFDPLADLNKINDEMHAGQQKQISLAERKDTWKMNYKMKNNFEENKEKEKLIEEVITPQVKEIVQEQIVKPLLADTKDLISKIDEYDENSRALDMQLGAQSKENQQLKDALPLIEEQIAQLKKELAAFDKVQLTTETIEEELFKPKSEVAAEISTPLKEEAKAPRKARRAHR